MEDDIYIASVEDVVLTNRLLKRLRLLGKYYVLCKECITRRATVICGKCEKEYCENCWHEHLSKCKKGRSSAIKKC